MKITFLGTRGYIDATTRRHKRHTSTLITYKQTRLLIDCCLDWLTKIAYLKKKYKPDALFITHAHPDHAWGLKNGALCPVYATKESWQIMAKYPIKERHIVNSRKKVVIGGVTIETFPVVHSIRAPAVGYRITARNTIIFCAHDLVYIEHRKKALNNIDLYIGDGASIKRPIIRKRDGVLFGHSPISTQLTWCKKEGVPRAIFTHCGSEIVEGDGRTINAKIQALGKERGVEVQIAHDGLEIEI
jgi:phosphoribosyl 1,2-cyclic phosphodiesterase